MNKYIILLIIVLFCVSFVSAAATPEDSGWNILKPGWNNIIGLWGESVDEATVPGMFGYTLKGWEVNTCSQFVTSDLSTNGVNGFVGVSTDLSKIYDTAATLSAVKTNNSINETLIEVSWYVQPKGNSINYVVYLMRGPTEKVYIAPKNKKADPAQGDTGYDANYYPISYTKAVLEYQNGQQILSTDIPIKQQ